MSVAWGGYSNGQIPPAALKEVDNFSPIPGTHSSAVVLSNLLRADAASQCRALQAAFARNFNKPLNVSEAYRTIYTQQAYKDDEARGGAVAAAPGTSVHGWALAVDFGSGVATYGTPEKVWMDANAPKYGFDPTGNTFIARGFKANEAWHFEFTGTFTEGASSGTPTPIEDDDMPLTSGDITKIGDEVLGRLLASNAWDELSSRTKKSAVNSDTLVAAISDLPRAVWAFILASGSSASSTLRLIFSATVK